MRDPNEKLNEILGSQDDSFRKLQKDLEELKMKFRHATHDGEKERILKKMTSLREQVDARISYARSA